MAKGKSKERSQPKEGQIFIKVYKNKKYSLKIVKEGGKTKFKVGNEIFNSPSGAAKYVSQCAQNGWIFWGIEK